MKGWRQLSIAGESQADGVQRVQVGRGREVEVERSGARLRRKSEGRHCETCLNIVAALMIL